jgi:XTP/dITP diphosphohydrolase
LHFLIASTNKHKSEEIEKIFNNTNRTFSSLAAYDEVPVAVENGKNFLENATIKAKHYYKYVKKPVIADDSGLVVPALNGAPGIHSARYAGEGSGYNKNNSMLLEQMARLSEKERYAFFICVVVFYDGKNLVSAEGRVDGLIIDQARGGEGFGYDPLFFYPPKGKTFAELSAEDKNKISHRSKALQQLKEKLDPFILNNS